MEVSTHLNQSIRLASSIRRFELQQADIRTLPLEGVKLRSLLLCEAEVQNITGFLVQRKLQTLDVSALEILDHPA